jgi:membrane-associated protease RseP (regulator of RpoE activity)
MGSPPFPDPWPAAPREPLSSIEPPPPIPAYVPFWRREPRTRYVVLFVLTLLSTTWQGAAHYVGFQGESALAGASVWDLFGWGLYYSLSVLAILGAHEFGHYFACVYYRVNASLPYFLPFPLFLTGTLGAVIRIRQPMPSKRALFDIGIAGPLAGFAVALPLLIVGVALSRVVAVPEGGGIYFGEPLLFKAVEWWMLGPIAEGHDSVLHPIGFAAWFGLIATALNLFPIGQLDGGHISYAVFGQKSTAVTIATALGLVGLTFVSMSWVLWTALVLVMLFTFGPRHPRVFDEHVPLDPARKWLAFVALVVFVVCFTPAPIEILDLVPR